MAKVDKIESLTPDQRNANRGTARGRSVLEKSLRDLGAGRSILVDKNGAVIAGNKTLEVAAELGLPIEIVETDGRKLIVVKRRDLDLNTDSKARKLAYADNRVSELDLDWDEGIIALDVDAGIDVAAFFSDGELARILERADALNVPSFEPNLEPESGRKEISEFDVNKASGKLAGAFDRRADQSQIVDLICPHCGQSFGVSKEEFK